MHPLAAFASGMTFGIGLIVSGMTDPSKVIGFLDVAGRWDPSLAFVMAGAILVGVVAFRIAGKRAEPVFGGAMRLPSARGVDRRLLLGSVVFGVGWGLAGYCPGPALVALGSGRDEAVVFTLAMLAGMGAYELMERWKQQGAMGRDE